MKRLLQTISKTMTLIFLLGTFFVPNARAENVDVQNVDTQTFSGEVIKIDNRNLTVKTDNETKEITVPQNIQIKRNSVDSNFESIKVNDKISFTQSQNGEVLSLSTTTGTVSDIGKYAIPAAIGLVLILGILALLMRNRGKGSIKTSIEKVK
jgi:hypothetical protein